MIPAPILRAAAALIAAFALAAAARADETTAPASPAAAQSEEPTDEWMSLSREERRTRGRQRNRLRYEPSGEAPSPANLANYIERFKQFNVYDDRLYLYRVEAAHVPGTTGTVKLTGEVNVPQYKTGTESTLRDLGFTVESNDIAVLPDPELGSDGYGIVTTASATVRRHPVQRAEQVNAVAQGGWLRLLRKARAEDLPEDMAAAAARRGRMDTPRRASAARRAPAGLSADGWYLVQTPEGYLGFTPETAFRPVASIPRMDALALAPTTVTLGTTQSATVPAGALLRAALLTIDAPIRYAAPLDDNDAALTSGPLRKRDISAPAFTREEILALTAPFMDTRYVWGGVTDGGVDCSGFTQFVYKATGVFLPRDAEQQAIVGQITAFGREVITQAQPGDIIFFASETGRVSHVGISLGNGQFIHSQRSGVMVSPLEEIGDGSERSFIDRTLFSRRVYAP